MEKMKTITINNIKEVYEFVAECSRSKAGLDIFATQGKAVIPCTSIMGMFAIDTSIPFIVSYPDNKDTIDFDNYLSKFEVIK